MYKIAVVEDERLESEALCKMLEESGRNWKIVTVAYSGPEALEKISKTDPDIILLDINIPEIDGLEVLRRVKKADPYKRVIIITAFTDFGYAHQAIKGKVDDYLLKPIRPQQLYDAIDLVTATIKSNIEDEFDERMNAVLQNVVNRNYSKARQALQVYLGILYNRCGKDLVKIQNEVQVFLNELNAATRELSNRAIPDVTKMFRNKSTTFKDQYELYTELKRILDRIFDILIENDIDNRNTIEGILNYVDRNCHRDISLNEVGDYANMSSYYVSKIFKKEIGVNFVTYLTDRKVELAKDMLVFTDIPIINIALELSYHEPNYFSKVFKKATGVTPTEYRKREKNRLK